MNQAPDGMWREGRSRANMPSSKVTSLATQTSTLRQQSENNASLGSLSSITGGMQASTPTPVFLLGITGPKPSVSYERNTSCMPVGTAAPTGRQGPPRYVQTHQRTALRRDSRRRSPSLFGPLASISGCPRDSPSSLHPAPFTQIHIEGKPPQPHNHWPMRRCPLL